MGRLRPAAIVSCCSNAWGGKTLLPALASMPWPMQHCCTYLIAVSAAVCVPFTYTCSNEVIITGPKPGGPAPPPVDVAAIQNMLAALGAVGGGEYMQHSLLCSLSHSQWYEPAVACLRKAGRCFCGLRQRNRCHGGPDCMRCFYRAVWTNVHTFLRTARVFR